MSPGRQVRVLSHKNIINGAALLEHVFEKERDFLGTEDTLSIQNYYFGTCIRTHEQGFTQTLGLPT